MLGCFNRRPRVAEPGSVGDSSFAAPPDVGAAVERAVVQHVAQDVIRSLAATKADLCWETDAKDHAAVVSGSYLELDEYASRGRRSLEQRRAAAEPAAASFDSPPRPAGALAPAAGAGSASGSPAQGSPGSPWCEGRLLRAGTLESANSVSSDPSSEAGESVEASGAPAEPDRSAEEIYAAHGLDFASMQGAAQKFLESLGMRPHEVGTRNYSRWRGRTLWNQCFYLSMAYGYLGHKASERRYRGLARRMRRAIEAVVLEQHPSWAAGLEASVAGTGKAMVFADFLSLAMHARAIPVEKNLLAKLVVCILDSVMGHAEVYIGPAYSSLKDREDCARNVLVLWHQPAHYQCVVRDDECGSKLDLTYEELERLLVEHKVPFIETRE